MSCRTIHTYTSRVCKYVPSIILTLSRLTTQHDDLVSLGKLIMTLCYEWFVPGQHPAAPLDHISRHYSPDVKNLVMYLCGKPPSGIKSIDEVVGILGLRILNEFDAMQK